MGLLIFATLFEIWGIWYIRRNLRRGWVYTYGTVHYRKKEPYMFWSGMALLYLIVGAMALLLISTIHAEISGCNPNRGQLSWKCK